MAKTKKPGANAPGGSTAARIARDDAIEKRYRHRPNLRGLYESGQIDQEAYSRAQRLCAAGPPARPFRELIAALRAERQRQGLSLADLAERTGMDRAAIHKLEIGLNRNPTLATLTRYAGALGARIEWALKTCDSTR
jgi:DNA-binding XRE family transcriptional regulator